MPPEARVAHTAPVAPTCSVDPIAPVALIAPAAHVPPRAHVPPKAPTTIIHNRRSYMFTSEQLLIKEVALPDMRHATYNIMHLERHAEAR